MSYPAVTVDDREPPKLVDELAELGSEVEVEHMTIGDFEGKTTIGEMERRMKLIKNIVFIVVIACNFTLKFPF